MSKRKRLFHGAGVLALAGIIVKLAGAVYKIPLGIMLGPVGMADFSIAYNVYSLLFVLATAGVPVAVSKMVAESLARKHRGAPEEILLLSKRVFSVFGFSGAALMFAFAPFLAKLMGNEGSALAIRTVSPAVCFVSVAAVFRGYFQGHSDMYPTAVSEILEAFGKLFVGLALAFFLKRKGAASSHLAAGAVFGVSAGSLLSVIYFKFKGRAKGKVSGVWRERLPVIRRLLSLSVPITVGAAVVSLTAVIDSALVMNLLRDAGFSEYRSKWLFGGYTYASTLFSLPSFFIATIAATLVPGISSCLAEKSFYEADQLVNSGLRLSMLISSLAAFGMAALSRGVIGTLYGSGADAECLELSSKLLQCLTLGIIPLSAVTVTNAVHQAMGRTNVPVFSILLGGAIKLVSNYLLVSRPEINIFGAAISTVICYTVAAGVNLLKMRRYSYMEISFKRTLIAPLIVGISVFLVARVTYFKTENAFGLYFSTFLSIFVGALVGIFGTFLLRIVRKEDGKLIFGNANIFKFIDND